MTLKLFDHQAVVDLEKIGNDYRILHPTCTDDEVLALYTVVTCDSINVLSAQCRSKSRIRAEMSLLFKQSNFVSTFCIADTVCLCLLCCDVGQLAFVLDHSADRCMEELLRIRLENDSAIAATFGQHNFHLGSPVNVEWKYPIRKVNDRTYDADRQGENAIMMDKVLSGGTRFKHHPGERWTHSMYNNAGRDPPTIVAMFRFHPLHLSPVLGHGMERLPNLKWMQLMSRMELLATYAHAQKFGLARRGHVSYNFTAPALRDMPEDNALMFGTIYKVPFASEAAHAQWLKDHSCPVMRDTPSFKHKGSP